jgi:hypothetical protein
MVADPGRMAWWRRCKHPLRAKTCEHLVARVQANRPQKFCVGNSVKHFLRLVAVEQDFVIGSAAAVATMLVVLVALQWA